MPRIDDDAVVVRPGMVEHAPAGAKVVVSKKRGAPSKVERAAKAVEVVHPEAGAIETNPTAPKASSGIGVRLEGQGVLGDLADKKPSPARKLRGGLGNDRDIKLDPIATYVFLRTMCTMQQTFEFNGYICERINDVQGQVSIPDSRGGHRREVVTLPECFVFRSYLAQ